MATQTDHSHALEVTAIFLSGLGTLMLVVLSAWAFVYINVGQQAVGSRQLGEDIGIIGEDSQRYGYLQSIESSSGQVAGITDSASPSENSGRNDAAVWLMGVREEQNLGAAYRDGVLDRNAQNHARSLADTCDTEGYNDWSSFLNTQIDEGFVTSFSEAAFAISNRDYLSQFPATPIPYSRLFTNYDAFGVGYAETAASAGCDSEAIVVYHLAGVR